MPLKRTQVHMSCQESSKVANSKINKSSLHVIVVLLTSKAIN